MTDLETAVAYLLPQVWQPGQYSSATGEPEPCPPLTRDLAMRLLEAAKLPTWWSVHHQHWCVQAEASIYHDIDLSIALVRAAAAMVYKNQQ